MTQPLLVLVPIEPCLSGNGLAMRVATFAASAAAGWDVQVAVVPVAGQLPFCPRPVAVPVVTVAPSEHQVVARRFAAMLADPSWRSLLADAEPMPPAARAASPALTADVLAASASVPGTPVLVIRSYLAPLALSVAEQLKSPWTALDLDDDDELLASARGDETTAAAYGRLLAAFAPRFSAVSLASPSDACCRPSAWVAHARCSQRGGGSGRPFAPESGLGRGAVRCQPRLRAQHRGRRRVG